MPAPSFGLGEVGQLGVTAGGGDIRSQDDFMNGFNTGAFSLNGGEGAYDKLLYLIAGLAILGFLIWVSRSNRS